MNLTEIEACTIVITLRVMNLTLIHHAERDGYGNYSAHSPLKTSTAGPVM